MVRHHPSRTQPLRRRLIAALAAVVALVALAACNRGGSKTATGSSGSASKNLSIIFASSAVDANVSVQIKGMKEIISKREASDGVKVDFQVLDAQMNANTQISQLQNAIVKKPTVIVVDPVDLGPLVNVVKQAKSDGIKVFSLRPSSSDPAGLWDGIADEQQLETIMTGNMVAWMKSQLAAKDPSSYRVGLLYGAAAQTGQLGREDVIKTLAKEDPSSVQVVASKIANWNLQQAQDATANFITAHPDMNLVVAANNQMAAGTVNSISAANKTGQIQVATYYVDPDTVKAIVAGKITYATGFEPFGVGEGVMTAALNLAEGKAIGAFDVPIFKVTKANAAAILPTLHTS